MEESVLPIECGYSRYCKGLGGGAKHNMHTNFAIKQFAGILFLSLSLGSLCLLVSVYLSVHLSVYLPVCIHVPQMRAVLADELCTSSFAPALSSELRQPKLPASAAYIKGVASLPIKDVNPVCKRHREKNDRFSEGNRKWNTGEGKRKRNLCCLVDISTCLKKTIETIKVVHAITI